MRDLHKRLTPNNNSMKMIGLLFMHALNKTKTAANSWLEIKKVLSNFSEPDTIRLIGELYSLSKANQDFLDARFLKNNEVLLRYKNKIKQCLAPTEPWKKNTPVIIKEAKKAISDYKKASTNKINLIELMVYYVECGTDFLEEFGDMYEQYYMSLESVFENVVKLMKQFDDRDVDDFLYRLKDVVKKAGNMGWGYGDNIGDILKKAYQ